MKDQDHEAVRRALRTLSDGTPARPWTRAAVERRVAELRRRRVTGAGGALVVAAVVGLAAVQMPAGPRQTLRPAADALPSLPAPLPTVSDLPPILPTPGETPPPSRKPRPTPTETGTEPEPEPSRPPAYDGPVQVKVTAEPAQTETATSVHFSVHVRQPRDVPVLIGIDFGDGNGWQVGRASYDPCAVEWDAESEYTLDYTHAYRAAGDYEVVVSAHSFDGDSCQRNVVTDRVKVHVAQGAALSNGPALPRVKAIVREVESDEGVLGLGGRSVWRLRAHAYDEDGWITRIVVDWGDGSEPEVVDLGTEGCVDSPTRWPTGRADQEIDHEYTDGERHTITVTATSAGCDGRDEQTTGFRPIPAGG